MVVATPFTLTASAGTFGSTAKPIFDNTARLWRCTDANSLPFNVADLDETGSVAVNFVLCDGFPNPTVPVFMQLFTSAERQAIRAKVANTGSPDEVLNDWWAILQDQRTLAVALPGPNQPGLGAQQAIEYLAEAGLIASGRVAQILAGQMQ